jgi:threonine dehydrogenase-like Zn-dependent dehydrogenase
MEECAEPVPNPAAGEIVIAVEAAGICGSELSGFLGQNSLRVPPLIMGHEAAGTIAQGAAEPLATGETAAPGMRVTFNPLVVCGRCAYCRSGRSNLCRQRQLVGAHRPGAFAQFVAVPAHQCHLLPEHLSFAAGSLAEPLACSLRSVKLAEVQPDESLLIIGAGPIGLCALAAARAQGVEQIAISDVAPERLALAARWGASEAIDARKQDVALFVSEKFAGGVDRVIDAVGTTLTRTQAIRAVRAGGRVVLIGLHDEESVLPANYIVRNEITLAGTFAYSPDDFSEALELLKEGVVQPSGDWLEERPLKDGPTTFAELIEGKVKKTKVVLRVVNGD